MKHLKIETSLEDLTSRLPGMFAYVEFNDDGEAVVHPGVDSVDGCYGKIVENIALPCGINLCTYVEYPEEAISRDYYFTDTNTIRMDRTVVNYYTSDSPEYLRQPNNFTYDSVEYDQLQTYELVDNLPDTIGDDDPEWVMTPQRDRLGDVVEDCDHHVLYNYYQKVPHYQYFKKQCIFIEGETYSYRTLIYYYYKLKDELGEGNPFIAFMNEGIGKIYVDKVALGLDNESVYPDVPEYIYLAESSDLYNKYLSYHKLREYYSVHYIPFGLQNEQIEAKVKTYEKMGGDRMMNWLLHMTDVAQETSELYLCYANNRAYDVSAFVNIPLFQSFNDLGYRESYISQFVPGERYQHGDIFTYEDHTYICLLDRFVAGSDLNFDYIRCNDVYKKLSSGSYMDIHVEKCYTIVLPTTMYNNAQYIQFCGKYYSWTGTGYEEIEMHEWASSWIDEVTWQYMFDDQHFVPITELAQDKWYDDINLYGTSYKIFYDNSTVPTYYVADYVRVNGQYYKWDGTQYMTDPDQAMTYVVSGSTSSQLRSLANSRNIFDVFGTMELPDPYEDWLTRYTIGNISHHIESRDEFGNIARWNDYQIYPNTDITDLYAYGDVLLDITADQTNHTITFVYVLNGHLKAILCDPIDSDEDGNPIYRYNPFTYDPTSNAGIVFTETYNYSDPDIDTLINNGHFQAFVEGRYNDIPNFYTLYGFKHFAFTTNVRTARVTMSGSVITSNYVPARFEEVVENQLDTIYSPTFHRDYLNGVMFQPQVDSDVNVQRGNGALFERNIRLSEVHSMEDLENEQNGSMFRFTE